MNEEIKRLRTGYNLGLVLSDTGIGFAATKQDDLCKPVKYHGKPVIGIRKYDPAQTAEERRVKRSARRMNDREQERVKQIQLVFEKEIEKKDPVFFIRLNESNLIEEDRSIKTIHPLFNDQDYTDKEYYAEYPSIYHLRKELISNPGYHDIRLYYLAVSHIVKNIGHFLYHGGLRQAVSFSHALYEMLDSINEMLSYEIRVINETAMEMVLKDQKITKKERKLALKAYFSYSAMENEKSSKQTAAIDAICGWLVGNVGNIQKVFPEESFDGLEKTSFKISDAAYEEKIYPVLQNEYPEYAVVVEKLKELYDWSVLEGILMGEQYLSYAKVKGYEKHKKNLSLLKRFIRKYLPDSYHDFFLSEGSSNPTYPNYIGTIHNRGKKTTAKKCSAEDFYKALHNIWKNVEPDDEDKALYDEMTLEIDNCTLLPLERCRENRVIPYQLHEAELKMILENASRHFPFLKATDQYGTMIDKILATATFRVPYYVGPLSSRPGPNTWCVRKAEGKITAQNFEEKIDLAASNEQFIRRMTAKCSYLAGEDVLPKNSLLYASFTVLNELNILRVYGKPITVTLKQDIYRDLFCKQSHVTGKALVRYLQKTYPGIKLSDLGGFDKDLKSSLTAFLDFQKIYGDHVYDHAEEIEKIILWKTLYGFDNSMFLQMVERYYPGKFTAEQKKIMTSFSYKGWARLSKRFLIGFEGREKDTGKFYTVLKAMWDTNCNLSQILSKRFTFEQNRIKANHAFYGDVEEVTYENTFEDLYLPPANKRTGWQMYRIIDELTKLLGCPPSDVFLVSYRHSEEKKKTKSRKEQLLDLYKQKDIKNQYAAFLKEIQERPEDDFRDEKLYLYYLQLGRCMYTGNAIDLDSLLHNNHKWNRDHIYPQSKFFDDSLDNLVLVDATANKKKEDQLLPEHIRKERKEWWTFLNKQGFLSKKKYDRLMRATEFTDEELAGFLPSSSTDINYTNKVLSEVIARVFKTKVHYVKANMISDFRNAQHVYKDFVINNLSDAKDAYLAIVVGGVYAARFSDNPLEWIRKNKNSRYNVQLKKIMEYDVFDRNNRLVWSGIKRENLSLPVVLKTLQKNEIFRTERVFYGHGAFYNEQLSKKSDGKLRPAKKGWDTSKYGGYDKAKTYALAWIRFLDAKGNRMKHLTTVPLYVEEESKARGGLQHITRYLNSIPEYDQVEILMYPIPLNSLFLVDGFPCRIRGVSLAQLVCKGTTELILDPKFTLPVRRMNRMVMDVKSAKKKYPDPSRAGFEESMMIELYDELVKKSQCDRYKNRPASQTKVLLSGREKFLGSPFWEKAETLLNILVLFRSDVNTKADLRKIGGSQNAGGMNYSKNTLVKNSLILVNQSVTGMRETKTVLA